MGNGHSAVVPVSGMAYAPRRSPWAWVMKKLHNPVYQARLRVLVEEITPHLQRGDSVLDVGCGFGSLSRAVLDGGKCPQDVTICGLEKVVRRDSFIEVNKYDGGVIPHEDNSFDVVILADVLHHATEPEVLIRQCVRVARRALILKDHRLHGILGQQRLSFIDWAANSSYGIRCLYRYGRLEDFAAMYRRHRLEVEYELPSLNLYPPVYNLLFGRKLQYFAVLAVAGGE